MFAQEFFHVDHVVPLAEFVSAAVHGTDKAESHACMEIDAVVGVVFIAFVCRVCNRDYHIEDALQPESFCKGIVKSAPGAASFTFRMKVD